MSSSPEPRALLPLDQVFTGDCLDLLPGLPGESVDLVFGDPPYNLQIDQPLLRPDRSRVNGVDDDWDHFRDLRQYDEFTSSWLAACRRVLKPNGTIWVIGSYHNIYRVGAALQDLGFWILNDIIWIKTNPMPNFRGVRFTNAHEILIWAQKEKDRPYTFNHKAMKAFNDGAQMRSDWVIPVCKGKMRIRESGIKVHTAQKPEALLYRVLLASTNPGDVVLDPFFGTGTTGVVAKKLGRHFIGIEKEQEYAEAARLRIQGTFAPDPAYLVSTPSPRMQPRIPFGNLLAHGLLIPGQSLYWNADPQRQALINADGSIVYNQIRGTIHEIARNIQPAPCNGWEQWFYLDPLSGKMHPIDRLRNLVRQGIIQHNEDENE